MAPQTPLWAAFCRSSHWPNLSQFWVFPKSAFTYGIEATVFPLICISLTVSTIAHHLPHLIPLLQDDLGPNEASLGNYHVIG